MRRRFGAIAVVAVVAMLVGGCSSVTPSVAPSPTAGLAPAPASATGLEPSGHFRLVFESPSSLWHAGEAIAATARLEYLKPGVATLFGSGSGVVGFGIDEVNGTRDMGPAWTADCGPHAIGQAAPIVTPITKSGGIGSTDPNAAFWHAFFADPLYRLPAGDWDLTATASFDVGTCTPNPVILHATIHLHVLS